ncbi:MAG: DnaJ domain-containing protein [Lachnospiraceae bacterium]|nr:DnaJ domain-containing protein [Lachnospiraceae bacterium]MCI7328390.1 DnaJ domain-containing protein [Lachnospiraceae bacterium]MDD7701695.1 DnaJ domain-containing protein [Lachnospiraceae bacterium]
MTTFTNRADALRVLGFEREVSEDEIRAAYHTLVKELHPDADPDPDLAWQIYDIQAAYQYLQDHPEIQITSRVASGPQILGSKSQIQEGNRRRKEAERIRKVDREANRRKKEHLIELQKEAEDRQKCLREEEEAKLRHEEAVERAVQTVRAMRAAKIIQDYLKENPDDLSSQ